MPYYEELRTLISDYLEDLEHNRLPVISRRTGYTIELIQKVLVELRKLNPKPGADYNNVAVPPVTPDVFVELDRERASTVCGWRMDDAEFVHQPLLPQAFPGRGRPATRRASISSGR